MKVIETEYKGYRFRSRLEARWAVFFDTLNIKWEYEKEGYELSNGQRYLPDFWLPDQKVWVEIKGQEPSEEYWWKIKDFSSESDTAIVLFKGLPLENWGTMFAYDICSSSAGSWEGEVMPVVFPRGRYGFICKDDGKLARNDRFIYSDHNFENSMCIFSYETLINLYFTPELQIASRKAKSARFEFL